MTRFVFTYTLLSLSLLAQFDAQRLAEVPKRMQEFAQKGALPGTVVMVSRNGKVALHEATGMMDLEAGRPMRPDTIFQIMSMTKPVTGTAVMMLVEEGRLSLLDPVEKYLPEFRGLTLKDGSKPARLVTIRDLMTHTSGFSGLPEPLKDLYQTMRVPLGEAVSRWAKQPLQFEPGSRWEYSNTGIATLGRIVEVVSEMPYERFVSVRLLEPLGMKDTFYFPPTEKRQRIAPVYVTKNGKLRKGDATLLGGDPAKFREGAKFSAPEFGLHSTASDLAAFYNMMANGGTYGGRKYLSRAGVRTMSMNHTGDIKAGWVPGSGFGLTWEVTKDAMGSFPLLSPGAFHHGGAFDTFGWVDPKTGIVGVFLTAKPDGGHAARNAFIRMVYAAAE